MGSATTSPAVSLPRAPPGAGDRLPASPPLKSAMPRVAAAPRAAAGGRDWVRQKMLTAASQTKSGAGRGVGAPGARSAPNPALGRAAPAQRLGGIAVLLPGQPQLL